MSAVMERPILDKMQAFARHARLASASQEVLPITPDVTGVLADYLQATLAAAKDQARFWTKEWQAGERETEAWRLDVTRSLTRWKNGLTTWGRVMLPER